MHGSVHCFDNWTDNKSYIHTSLLSNQFFIWCVYHTCTYVHSNIVEVFSINVHRIKYKLYAVVLLRFSNLNHLFSGVCVYHYKFFHQSS